MWLSETKSSRPSALIRNVVSPGKTARTRYSLLHRKGTLISHNQQAAGGVDRKSARMEAMCVCALDQRWFTGDLIDAKDADGVFSAAENRRAVEIHGILAAVSDVNEFAARMHMNRARALASDEYLRDRPRYLFTKTGFWLSIPSLDTLYISSLFCASSVRNTQGFEGWKSRCGAGSRNLPPARWRRVWRGLRRDSS